MCSLIHIYTTAVRTNDSECSFVAVFATPYQEDRLPIDIVHNQEVASICRMKGHKGLVWKQLKVCIFILLMYITCTCTYKVILLMYITCTCTYKVITS